MSDFARLLLGLIFVAVSSFGGYASDATKEQYRRPLSIPFPGGAPYSPQMATLGKMLFFDPRLSGAENMNCASCHNPSFGYEVPVPTPIGATNERLGRQAPTILNVAWVQPLFWDGRAATLEEQAAGPITASVEMDGKFDVIVERLADISEYADWFASLFPGQGVTKENILTAIATYERTVVSDWAPFDRWIEGDEQAISASARQGFEIFNGQGNCAVCHSGWLFTDNQFHDIGMPTEDIGRAKLEPNNMMAKHAFKTPSMRNLTHRSPFMHNGTLATLEDVVEFYDTGGVERPSRSEHVRPLNLSIQQKRDLVAFLKSLTADKNEVSMPTLPN